MIRVEHLTYQYPDEAEPSIRDLSLEIQDGTFVAILGHNGSGKSTLAKHFNGILLPTQGKVFVDGVDVYAQNEEQLRARVDEALKLVGMYDYRLHAPLLLSGGQKQRVAIAGVIAMRPKCIVLDEPTAMLDPVGRQEVVSTVTRLCREQGITVVHITHHMEECIGADRLIVMSEGRVVADGSPVEVFSQVELLESEGLDVPATTRLIYELNQAGMHLPMSALTVQDCAAAIAGALKKQ